MRRYETLFIITPDSSEEDLKAVATKFQDVITSMQGLVASYKEQGKKKLAYSVSKGYFVLMDYVASADVVAEIERNMRLDDRILKYLTVKLADEVDQESIKEHKPEPQETAESAEAPEPVEAPSPEGQQNEVEESSELVGQEEKE